MTLRELYGDQFDTLNRQLIEAGHNRNDRIRILREGAAKQMAAREAGHQGRIAQEQQALSQTATPAWYRDDNPASNFVQGVTQGGANLISLFSDEGWAGKELKKYPGGEYTEAVNRFLGELVDRDKLIDFRENEQLIHDNERIAQLRDMTNRNSARQAQKDALHQAYAHAEEDTGDKVRAGLVNLYDDLVHPDEWNLARFAGELVTDPTNALVIGRGIKAGALTGGLTGGGENYALAASRSDKTEADANAEGLIGTVAGTAGGAVINAAPKVARFALSKDGRVVVKDGETTSKSNQNDVDMGALDKNALFDAPETAELGDAALRLHERIVGKIDAETMPKSNQNDSETTSKAAPFPVVREEPLEVEVIAREEFARIITEAEQAAIAEDGIVKAYAAQLAQIGVPPHIIEEQLNARVAPSPDDLLISEAVTDDGVTLPNRMSGMRFVPMVINEISRVDADPAALYDRMRERGFDAEIAGSAMQSAIDGTPDVFLGALANRLNQVMSERTDKAALELHQAQNDAETTTKSNQNEIKEGVADEPEPTQSADGGDRGADTRVDPAGAANRPDGEPATRGADGEQQPRNDAQADALDDGTGVRDGGSDAGRNLGDDGVPTEAGSVARQPAARRDGGDDAGSGRDAVVSPEVRGDRGDGVDGVETTPKSNQNDIETIRGAYKQLSERDGFSHVLISDLAEASGVPVERVKSYLQDEGKGGRATFGAGDWSLSSPAARDAAITINDQPHTRVRLLEEAMDRPTSKSNQIDAETTPYSPAKNLDLRDRAPVQMGKAARKKINTQVEAILKKETISAEDAEVLRQYTGKGGLESGSSDALNQHYTGYETVRGIFDALERAGVKMDAQTRALEPAVGAGNFVGHRPEMRWTTVDVDPVAHQVAAKLYPEAEHYHAGFESFKKGDYDLIVSNVPFLETRGASRAADRPDIKALHDYYFAASLDKVKDNGVIAYVTSKGVMDKADAKVRAEIVEKADVIGAYRLPAKTFAKNAHTDVIADVIFLQKRPDGVKSHAEASNAAFVESAKSADGIYLNRYYEENPSHILGEMRPGKNMYGGSDYEVRGVADYTQMSPQFKPYKTTAKSKQNDAESTPNVVDPLESIGERADSKEFAKLAQEHGIEYYDLDAPALRFESGHVKAQSRRIEYSDVQGGAKLYEDISDTKSGKKLLALEQIRQLGDASELEAGSAAIKAYKKQFKTHPSRDRALGKLMREIGEGDRLHEYSSYFDKEFTPAPIFSKQTRYSGSGRIEVDAKSPLRDRMLLNEDHKGVVDLKSAQHLRDGEIDEALQSGYALLDEGRVQNDALYYSGNIYQKLDALDGVKAKTKAQKDAVQRQRQRLEATRPTPKTLDEIDLSGMLEDLAARKVFKARQDVKWKKLPDGAGERKEVRWVTEYGKTFDRYMNNEALIKRAPDDSAATYKRRLREAREEVEEIIAQIDQKVRRDETLRAQIESKYNRESNFYVEPDHGVMNGMIKDVVEEMQGGIKPRPHQSAWVAKALYEGKGINAHDVGLGKTISGVMLGRALKARGMAKKPMIVAPAKVLSNWENNIKKIYPDAKVVNLGQLTKSVRTKKLFELANMDADYVLISHEGFEHLRLPRDVEARYARDLLDENLRNADLKGRRKALNEEAVKAYLAALEKSNDNPAITIDKLGIDAVIVDEARAFKNVAVSGKLAQNNVGKPFGMTMKTIVDEKGVTQGHEVSIDSAKAYDFRFKTKYISGRNNDRNIFILDATPTPNKPMELFTMLKHLDDNIFKEYGIHTDRDFADRFFDYGIIMRRTGKSERGLTAIKDAVTLRGIMGRFIDRISTEEAKRKKLVSVPEAEFVTHTLEQSEDGAHVFGLIAEKLDKLRKNRQFGKMMGVFSEAVSASTDPRLYLDAGIDRLSDATPANNRLEAVVQEVVNRRAQDQESGHVLFLDNVGHTAVKEGLMQSNLHRQLKAKLIDAGMDAKQIAILNGTEITNPKTGKEGGGITPQKKQAIVDAYDAGQIKVIIGTTKSAGEGMNIQKYTTDVYHVDLPQDWTMAEMIQREGRGVRQGNQNSRVRVHTFFQQGTFDQKMYQKIIGKRDWNDALWDSEVKDRIEIESEGGGRMSPEEQLIALEKDPIRRRELELELEYARHQEEHEALRGEVSALTRKMDTVRTQISYDRSRIREMEQGMKHPYPTEALKDLHRKMGDDPKKYTKKYETALAERQASQQRQIAARHAAIEKAKAKQEALKAERKTMSEDLESAERALRGFETKHMDDAGNIRAVVAGEDC